MKVYLSVFFYFIVVLCLPALARPDGATSLGGKLLYRSIARIEASHHGVPYHLVDAVMWVESGYNPSAKGGVGEVGLMQLLPTTAQLLGFRGSMEQLHRPRTNIRLGTKYLADAWRLGRKDICTAVMKYRAGHGETRFSVLSVNYCKKVRRHMKAKGLVVTGIVPKPTFGFRSRQSAKRLARAPGTTKCFARVVQPGPRFGSCISLSKLRRRGLLVKRPRKRKKK